MGKRIISVVLLLVSVGTALNRHTAEPLPRFEDFQVAESFRGNPAPAKPNSTYTRTFRTVIQKGAESGPNFAGHYTVVIWGYGTSCAQFAIVDAATGRAYDPPFKSISFDLALKRPGLHFRLKSSLFVAEGCPEEKDCAARYYEWNGSRLVLLRAEPIERSPLPHVDYP